MEGNYEIDSKENSNYWFAKNTYLQSVKHDHNSNFKGWNFATGDVEGPKLGFNDDLKHWITVSDAPKQLPVQRTLPPENLPVQRTLPPKNFSNKNFSRYKTSVSLNSRPSGDTRFENLVLNYYHPESYFAHRLESQSRVGTEVTQEVSEKLNPSELVDNLNATSKDKHNHPFVKPNFLNETTHIFNRNRFSIKQKLHRNLSQANVSQDKSLVNFDMRQENCNHIGGHTRCNSNVFEKKNIVLQNRKAVNDNSENLVPLRKPLVLSRGNFDQIRNSSDGLGMGTDRVAKLENLFKTKEVGSMNKFVSLNIVEDSVAGGQGLSKEDANTQYHQNHAIRPNYTNRRVRLRGWDSGGSLVSVGDNYRDTLNNTNRDSNLITFKKNLIG